MQGVSIVSEKEKGSACGKVTKGTARGETGVPCKEKSIGKGEEVKESREERGSTCG